MMLSIEYTDGTQDTVIMAVPTNISPKEAGIFVEQEVVNLWVRRKNE